MIIGGLIVGGAMVGVASGATAGGLATADFLAAADSVATGIADNTSVAWSALKAASRIAYTPIQQVKNFRSAQMAKDLGWAVHSWRNGLIISRHV